jgi:hypothetical protein
MLKTSTLVLPKFASPPKSKLLAQLISTPATVPLPAATNGDPGTGVSAPFGAIVNIPTASIETKATDRNLPSGETLMPSGSDPAGNGEPGIDKSVPFAPMLKTAMLREPELLANKNRLSEVTPNEIPEPAIPPVANGDPGTRLRAPVAGLIEKTLMLLLCSLATNRKLPTTQVVKRFAAKKPEPPPEPPVAKGDPAIGVNRPFASTENAETELMPARLLLM